MQIGELIRGFSEPGFPTKPVKDTGLAPSFEILPIRESDKPYQFDFPKFDSNDIQAAIKQSLKEAVLGKLFNASQTPGAGLLDGFNDNATPLPIGASETAPIESPVEISNLTYSYAYSFSESLSIDLSISDNQLSLDLSFSRSFSEDVSYRNTEEGIEYSSNSQFDKSFELSLNIDLGEDGQSPTLIDFNLNKFSNSSFTESLSISQPTDNTPPSNDSDGLALPSLGNNLNVSQVNGLASLQPAFIQPVSIVIDKSLNQAVQSQQVDSYEKRLISQLQQTDIGAPSTRSSSLINNSPSSNAVIQEYLLGLR